MPRKLFLDVVTKHFYPLAARIFIIIIIKFSSFLYDLGHFLRIKG